MSLNMTKQYRAELRDLKRNRKFVERDWKAFDRQHGKDVDTLRRQHLRARNSTSRELVRIAKRIAILEGRLS